MYRLSVRNFALISLICFLFSCSASQNSPISFLEGVWKIADKEKYEAWEQKANGEFSGYSYKLIDGKKDILETLSITKIGNEFVYEATVPNQNEGKTIQFVLNAKINNYLSFENDKHDFPKKIQYKKITDNEIDVAVLGSDNNGFTYKQYRE
ncbi:MAG: hypothetical protein COA96_10660 [SAR86 cluster bacterium]|uniref:DUF6265 domain-containing protein n=1 Tax=SAR86 cluster bacterium TaxID=2030880 RepID=A0A2A5AXT2_9GAMM|nr:MAG: hypothetical protein COA96_10660 [SAR86 cluster bacterium]